MTIENIICIICAIYIVAYYIWAKASGVMWYGVQWKNVFRRLRRRFCQMLCKMFNK